MREVTVYLPTGQTIVIPGQRARCGVMPNGVPLVEELLEDNGIRQFVGLPHSITIEAPNLIEPVSRPPLVRTS
jgi:hypothetical protein